MSICAAWILPTGGPRDADESPSAGESPEDDGARGGSNKGNKAKTSEKRRAQNRQAQRNFRERKEKVRARALLCDPPGSPS